MIERVARLIDEGGLIAVVGAGTSRSWTDPDTKKAWPGIPMGSEVAQLLTKGIPEGDGLEFPQICFMHKYLHGRSDLERNLLDAVAKTTVQPLPAHRILAGFTLPLYVTSNYDTLLERALEDAQQLPTTVIEDKDVSLVTPFNIPVVKYHGCARRPASMIACSDEYVPIDERSPVVSALLMAHLANRALLFVGYALNDPDFLEMYGFVSRVLGEHMPKSFAIVLQASTFERAYWNNRGVELIEGDLTLILRDLNRARLELRDNASHGVRTVWDSNPFFESLREIGTLPSETQVTEAFLVHLFSLLEQGTIPASDIIENAREAKKAVLLNRSNFRAFKRVTSDAIHVVENDDDPLGQLRAFIHERGGKEVKLARMSSHLPRDSTIGLYSQSMRVQQFLNGVVRQVQSSCRLMIGECRPKSPRPFQDAIQIAYGLSNTTFTMAVMPDVALLHMLANRQLTHMILGAHAVFVQNGEPVAFVNTAGSAAIASLCIENNVPLWVIADSDKLETVSEDRPVSYSEEESIFSSLSAELSDLKSRGVSITGVNIGYDLVACRAGQSIFTEETMWSL